ncbi:MAG: hypothetical protein WDO17_22280 [Alphaproteobacteria bacterium]
MPRIRGGRADGEHEGDEENAAHIAQTRKPSTGSEPQLNKAEQIFIKHFSYLSFWNRNRVPRRAFSLRVRGRKARFQEENMRKFALATAAVAALALSVPAFTAPASAQDVKVRIGDRHGDRHHGDHDRMRHRDVKKVIIHRDHGRHEGWRHHEGRRHEGHKTVIIKKREG